MSESNQANAARLLRLQEVSELLSVSTRMVHRLVAAGELRRVKIGNATRFRADDVSRFIERQTARADS